MKGTFVMFLLKLFIGWQWILLVIMQMVEMDHLLVQLLLHPLPEQLRALAEAEAAVVALAKAVVARETPERLLMLLRVKRKEHATLESYETIYLTYCK